MSIRVSNLQICYNFQSSASIAESYSCGNIPSIKSVCLMHGACSRIEKASKSVLAKVGRRTFVGHYEED